MKQKTLQTTVDNYPVTITFKPIKRVTLRVAPDGQGLRVSAPIGFPLNDIAAFIRKKSQWIDRQIEQLSQGPAAAIARATEQDKQEWKAVVAACVPPLVQAWEPILGVKAKVLVYRSMKSRWGSCQPATGRICINTHLALYPPACLEYVVVHELCHLLVANHGSEFYGLMDRVMPDWKERRKLLSA